MDERTSSHTANPTQPTEAYEPPALEDLVRSEGPSVTAALATTGSFSAPRDI